MDYDSWTKIKTRYGDVRNAWLRSKTEGFWYPYYDKDIRYIRFQNDNDALIYRINFQD